MTEEQAQSFTSMAAKEASEDVPEVGVGMLGYAFMGKAHSNAMRKLPYMIYPPPAIPRLVSISGRDEKALAVAAQRFGYEKYTTDWREQVNDPDIQLFDNLCGIVNSRPDVRHYNHIGPFINTQLATIRLDLGQVFLNDRGVSVVDRDIFRK